MGRPAAPRLMGLEAAAAALKVPAYVLTAWDAMDFGPVPVLRNTDGSAAAWTRASVASWASR